MFIVYIEGSQVIIYIKYCFSFSEDQILSFIANSADPDEMLSNAAFAKVPINWFSVYKG